jgi:DoxX-like family
VRKNVVLWVIQGLLAALFLFAGGAKEVMSAADMQQGPVVLPMWFLRGLGVCEMLGALGLILPGALNIKPQLTVVSAVCLSIIMVGAVVISAYGMGLATAIVPFVVLLLLIWVAWGRSNAAMYV